MTLKYGIETEKEAMRMATNLLFGNEAGELNLTDVSFVLKRLASSDGKVFPYFSLTDPETDDVVFIYEREFCEDWSLVYLTEKEMRMENRLYLYRNVSEKDIPILLAEHPHIFKPAEAIAIDESMTDRSKDTISKFLQDGIDYDELDFMEDGTPFSIDSLFEVIDNGDEEAEDSMRYSLQLACYPSLTTIRERSGLTLQHSSEYAEAFEKILNTRLTENEKDTIISSYVHFRSLALLRYAVYEFFRTEDYPHLLSILSEHNKFGLPDDWVRDNYQLDHIKADEKTRPAIYVLSQYLKDWNMRNYGGQPRLKEIAEFTNTPISLMIEASQYGSINRKL